MVRDEGGVVGGSSFLQKGKNYRTAIPRAPGRIGTAPPCRRPTPRPLRAD